MARDTLDTLPLHALHTYSAGLLAIWYGLAITEDELAAARERRPLGGYYVIATGDDDLVEVASVEATIAAARGKVAEHAPARVATLRHDARDHAAWPGDTDGDADLPVGARVPAALFDWTR